MSDEDISLELNRQFQEVKLSFIDDLTEAQNNLIYEKGERERLKKQADKTENIIKGIFRGEELEKLDKKISINRIVWCFEFTVGNNNF